MGMTKKNLVLITLNWEVFMVSSDSLDSAINNLYLGENSKPMSELWPILWENERFNKVKDLKTNAFFVMDAESDYFCICTNADKDGIYGVTYDIIRERASNGYGDKNIGENTVISANKPIIYYVMTKEEDYAVMMEFKFSNNVIDNHTEIVESSTKRYLCEEGAKIYCSEDKCEKPYPIPLLSGFVDDNVFYLFHMDHVIIFSVDMFYNINEQYTVINKNYSDFIQCKKANVTDHLGNSGFKKNISKFFFSNFHFLGSKTSIIIAISIGLLLLLLCCALLVNREMRKKESNKKQKPQKPKSKGRLEKSLRAKSSKNVMNPSMLKSARSTGSEYSGPKKLSTHVSKNPSAQLSTRSGGAGSFQNLSRHANPSQASSKRNLSSHKISKHLQSHSASKYNTRSVDITARSS